MSETKKPPPAATPPAVPPKEKIDWNQKLSTKTVRDWLGTMKNELAAALPSQVPIDRFIRVVNTSIRKNPKLLECTPMSFYGAVLTSAQIGLVPDGVLGEAYLIPRWNGKKKVTEVNFQPGYQGLLALCRRSGQIASINAQIVYENEVKQGRFKYQEGDAPSLQHEPIIIGEKGDPVAAYATATLKSGEKQIAVMSRDEINAIRDSYSKAGDKETGPWYDEVAVKWMWKKTTLIQLQKLLPRDTEDQNQAKLAKAVALDEKVVIGVPQDLSIESDPNAFGTVADTDNGEAGDDDEPKEKLVAHNHPEPIPSATTPEPDKVPVEKSEGKPGELFGKPLRKPA